MKQRKYKDISKYTNVQEKPENEDLDVQELPEESIGTISICNSCRNILPQLLDNGICPHCDRRTS